MARVSDKTSFILLLLMVFLASGCVEMKKVEKGEKFAEKTENKEYSAHEKDHEKAHEKDHDSPQYGGFYRIPLTADPPNLDPAHITDTTSHAVVAQIFEGLVEFNDQLEPSPAIAKSWDISDDGLHFTFYLKDNVKFHNGRKVNAGDFVYSFTRILDPKTASERSWLFNMIQGYSTFQEMLDIQDALEYFQKANWESDGIRRLNNIIDAIKSAKIDKTLDNGEKADGPHISKLGKEEKNIQEESDDLQEKASAPTQSELGKKTEIIREKRDRLFEKLLFQNEKNLDEIKRQIEKSGEVAPAQRKIVESLADFSRENGGAQLLDLIKDLRVQDFIQGGLYASDEKTLHIKLSSPFVPFLSVLAMPNAAVVPQEEVEDKESFSHHPVGAGPFTFGNWVHDEQISLKAFADYHRGRPWLDGIEYRIIVDPYTAFMEFEKGNFDSTGTIRIEDSIWPQVASNPRYEKLMQRHETMGIYYVGMNVNMAPFNDKRVRKAFNMAINTDSIVRVIRQNRVSPAHGILPPGMPGHDPQLKGYEYDKEKALALLAQAGYPQGKNMPEIELWYNTNPGHKSVCEIVQQNLAAIGVNIQLRNVDWGTYLKKVDNGQVQMFRLGWIADYPDPDNFLYVLLHSSNIGQGNGSRYHNPLVDELLDRAKGLFDHDQRIRLYQEAQRIVVEDAPWIPLYFYAEEFIAYEYVHGAKINAMGPAAMQLRKIWLSKK